MSSVPKDLRYTEDHEWVRESDDHQVVEVGITDYAQGELGDVVFVELPKPAASFGQRAVFGTIEAVKAVSELYSPLAGPIGETNKALEQDPAPVNRDRATIVATFELAQFCGDKGATSHAMHIGGAHEFPFGRVKLVPAFHGGRVEGDATGKYTTNPCGLVVTIGGKTVYHCGDTALTMEMQLLAGRIRLMLLPIGGNFTMGGGDAARADEFGPPNNVFPSLLGRGLSPLFPARRYPAERAGESRLVHGLHAVSAGDRAGAARSAAQLSDDGLGPDRPRDRECVVAR